MDNIRIEQLLGNKKVIVGTKYNDLVLETLGKVYIKSGNNFKLLTELIGTLNKSDPKNVLIVSNVTEMENMKYPGDGYFVFSSLNKALYISYDGRYIKLIEAKTEENPNYVRKSGDTMTGPLEINTTSAPLIVASSELIKNLNSELVGGYKAEDLAKIRKDEIIYGLWAFKNPCTSEDLWTFNKNVDVKGDIIIKGSIGSPSFTSGFGGYGWRFDADTNTLTVDYLVVRKAMNVYELVINLITATNGSLWVSNSTTIEDVEQPLIVTVNLLNYFELDEFNSLVGWQGTDLQKERFKALFFKNKYYLITDDVIGDTLSTNSDTKGREDLSPQNVGIVKETTSLSTSSDINNTEKVFVNYKYLIKITDIDGLLNYPDFLGKSTFLSENSLKNLSDFIKLTYISKKVYNNTYIETFDKDCGFYTRVLNTKIKIKSYYKYYALKKETIQSAINACIEYFNNTHNKSLNYTVPSLYIVTSKDYTYFKPGDIIRCQKFLDNNIKYYDAVVLSLIADKSVIIQKADSVFDQYTEVEYVDGNKIQYTTTYNDMAYNNGEKAYDVTTNSDVYLEGYETQAERLNNRLAEPATGDDIVLMGNIYDFRRLNAIYITSSDELSPYIDIIGDVNRPDYSVLYETPKYKKYSYINNTIDNGFRGRKYNYYLLAPTSENASIDNVVPIYKDGELLYYGTLQPLQNSLIEQLNGEDIYEYNSSTKTRLGKLDGIVNPVLKDKLPYGYGLYSENVFLTGEFYLNNGLSVVDFSKDLIDLSIKPIKLDIEQVKSDALKALNAADKAQLAADEANNLLLDIASDNKLTPSEKQQTKKEWDIIVSEKPLNDLLADKFTIDKSTYNDKYIALLNYITPLLLDLNSTSDIVGVEFRNYFKEYYDARTNLLNAISEKAKLLSDDINKGLLATGINILNKKITVTADSFIVQANNGREIGAFINDGNEVYFNASLIKADEIIANIGSWNKEIKVGRIDDTNYHFTVDSTGKLNILNDSKISKFSVTNQGRLIAQDANITGVINATSGTFSNVDIKGTLNMLGGSLTGTDANNRVTLTATSLSFYGNQSFYESEVAIGTDGTGVLPSISGLHMPVGISTRLTNPDMNVLENVGLYISATGAKKYGNVSASGNTAIHISNGFIKGLRLNVTIILEELLDGQGYYTPTKMDNYITCKSARVIGINLPSDALEGQFYIIKKYTHNGLLLLRIKGSGYISLNLGDYRKDNIGVDGSRAFMLVYTEAFTYQNQGIWLVNTLN